MEQGLQKKIGDSLAEGAPAITAESAKNAKTPEQAKLVAHNAALGADTLAANGNPEAGGRVLSAAADGLMKNGHFDEAQQLLDKMKKDPFAKTNLNISKGTDTVDDYGKTKITCNKNKFETTVGGAADIQQKQLDQLRKMKEVTGKVCDPHDMADAKLYFQKLSDQNPGKDGAKKVAEEFNTYQKNFFVHPGGVTWDKDIPVNDRPGRMNELLGSTHSDNAGRKMIDCEGYTYLTHAIFDDIKGKDGKPRFEAWTSGDGNHVVSSIYDPKAKAAFLYDNDQMKDMSAESALVGHGAALKRFHAPLNGQSASGGYRPDQIDPSTGKLKDTANLN